MPGSRSQTFEFEGTEQHLRVGFVNLNRDLRREQDAVLAELAELLQEPAACT